MALFATGPLVTSIQGSIGSTCFRTGRQATVYNTNPLTRRTSLHQRWAQIHFSAAGQDWKRLPPLSKAAWHAVARFYRSRYPTERRLHATGRQFFFACNIPRYHAGLGPTLLPPERFFAPPPIGLQFDLRSPTWKYIEFANVWPFEAKWFRFWGARPQSQIADHNWPNFRLLFTSTVKLPAVDLDPYFDDAFGRPNPGETILALVQQWNLQDLPSPPILLRTVVPPP